MARRARTSQATRAQASAVETGVGSAQVVADHDRSQGRTLVIDGHIHGHVDLARPQQLKLDYQARLTAIAAALVPGSGGTAVHLGGGAFAVPRALQASHPSLHQIVIERSAAIIRLAEREMGLRRDGCLVVRKGDARAALLRMPPASADIVIADAFLDGHTPRHLTTVEFMTDVARVLQPDGVYLVNLIDEQPWSVLGTHAAAATTAFGDVLAVGSRGVARLRDPGNVFLVASDRGINRAALTSALVGGAHPSALVPAGQLATLARRHRARHDADG